MQPLGCSWRAAPQPRRAECLGCARTHRRAETSIARGGVARVLAPTYTRAHMHACTHSFRVDRVPLLAVGESSTGDLELELQSPLACEAPPLEQELRLPVHGLGLGIAPDLARASLET